MLGTFVFQKHVFCSHSLWSTIFWKWCCIWCRDRPMLMGNLECIRIIATSPSVCVFFCVCVFLFFLDKSSESVDRLLLERFRKLSRFPEAFSSVQYWGTQTLSPPTDFRGLQSKLEQLLDNNATRSPRTPVVIFKALQVQMYRVEKSANFKLASDWLVIGKPIPNLGWLFFSP